MPLTAMTKRRKSAPPRPRSAHARARMILYARVSTDEQSNGLEAQRSELERAAAYQSWYVVKIVVDEGASGKDLERPGLRRALELIAAGQADGLAVSKLDRLSRSVIDAGQLAEWFERAGARLVALDLNLDTSTPAGLMVLHVLAAVAQWERETIAARTRAGLAALRSSGKPTGRPAVADVPELARRIRDLRISGLTLQAIADQLNAELVPTLRGGSCWRPSSVQSAAGYTPPSGWPPIPPDPPWRPDPPWSHADPAALPVPAPAAPRGPAPVRRGAGARGDRGVAGRGAGPLLPAARPAMKRIAQTKQLALSELSFYPANPRRGDVAAIAQFGALSAQYKQKHEPAYYCFKRGKTARWAGPTNEVTVWDVDRAAVNDLHPTQKPTELAARALRNHDSASVLDPFAGSGSTLIAAENLSRRCYAMEIDPGYCDVIVDRWERHTGKQARLDG